MRMVLNFFSQKVYQVHSRMVLPNVNLIDVVHHLQKLSHGQLLLLSQVFKLANTVNKARRECAFSAMRQIKTYLHNTMSQNRLNDTMYLSVHRRMLDTLVFKSILLTMLIKENSFLHECK